jgi:hypothetical protein
MEQKPPRLETFFRVNSYHTLCRKTARRKTARVRRRFPHPEVWLPANSRALPPYRAIG